MGLTGALPAWEKQTPAGVMELHDFNMRQKKGDAIAFLCGETNGLKMKPEKFIYPARVEWVAE